MSRKMIGVSEALHEELARVAKSAGVPMTLVIETLLKEEGDINWALVKEEYQNHKPSWKNIRKSILDYQEKFPEAPDAQLADFTGYSIAQVEVITHSAHKRCLAILAKKSVKPLVLSKDAAVSAKFAKRIWDQFMGVAKIPAQELYLWDTTGETPRPLPHSSVI